MAKINYPTYEPSYGYMTEKIRHAYVAMAIDKKFFHLRRIGCMILCHFPRQIENVSHPPF